MSNEQLGPIQDVLGAWQDQVGGVVTSQHIGKICNPRLGFLCRLD